MPSLFFSVFIGPLYCHGSSGVDVHTIWPSPELQTSCDSFTGSVHLQSFLNGVSLTRSYSSFCIKKKKKDQAVVALLDHQVALRTGSEYCQNWPLTIFGCVCCFCMCRLFIHIFLLGSWTVLLVKAVLTSAIALCSLFLFVTLVHSN